MSEAKQKVEQAKQQGVYVQKAHIIKGIDEEKNTVIARISPKVVDRDGEVVLPRSFEKDLDFYRDNPVVLFAHESQQPPIAQMVDHKITDDDFIAHDQFAVGEYPFAKMIFNLYRGRYLRAFSVGFRRIDISDAEDERLPGQTGITFTRSELLEHSAVTIPSNRRALVKIYEAVKDRWDETILKYFDKVIEQPQTLPCGHKAIYDYEGTVIEECPQCLRQGLSEKGYYWNGESLKQLDDSISLDNNKFFFFGPPPSVARIASLEQALADTEEAKETISEEPKLEWDGEALTYGESKLLTADELLREAEDTLNKRLDQIVTDLEVSYGDIAEAVKDQVPYLEKLANDLQNEEEGIKSVVSFKKYPLASKTASWSFSTANGDAIINRGSWTLYRDVHTYFDPSADEDNSPPEVKSAYKLPHHKISGGEVKTFFRGCAAAMVALMGGRGGVDIPSSERRGVYNHLSKHYDEYDAEPPEFREGFDWENPDVSLIKFNENELAILKEEDMRAIIEEAQSILIPKGIVYEITSALDAVGIFDVLPYPLKG